MDTIRKSLHQSFFQGLLPLDEEYRCRIHDHHNERVQFICVNLNCTAGTRVGCSYCQFTQHLNHLESVIYLRQFKDSTIAESEFMKQRLQDFPYTSSLSPLPISSKIKMTIGASMMECIEQFNRIIANAQENLFKVLHDYTLNHTLDTSTAGRLTDYRDRVNRTLQKPLNLLNPTEIELLVSLFNQQYEKAEYFAVQPIATKEVYRKVDIFFEKLKKDLDILSTDLNYTLKDLSLGNFYSTSPTAFAAVIGNSTQSVAFSNLVNTGIPSDRMRDIVKVEQQHPEAINRSLEQTVFTLPALKTLEQPQQSYNSNFYGRSTPTSYQKYKKDAYNPVYNPIAYSAHQGSNVPSSEYVITEPIQPRDIGNPNRSEAKKSLLRESRNFDKDRTNAQIGVRIRNSSLGVATTDGDYKKTEMNLRRSEMSPQVTRTNQSFELSPGRSSYVPLNTEPEQILSQTTYQPGQLTQNHSRIILNTMTQGLHPEKNHVSQVQYVVQNQSLDLSKTLTLKNGEAYHSINADNPEASFYLNSQNGAPRTKYNTLQADGAANVAGATTMVSSTRISTPSRIQKKLSLERELKLSGSRYHQSNF